MMLPDSRSLHHIMRRKKKVEEELSILIVINFGYTKIPKPKRGRVSIPMIKSPQTSAYVQLV